MRSLGSLALQRTAGLKDLTARRQRELHAQGVLWPRESLRAWQRRRRKGMQSRMLLCPTTHFM